MDYGALIEFLMIVSVSVHTYLFYLDWKHKNATKDDE